MATELITYQTFNDPALTDALITILEKHGIKYEVEEATASANPLLALNNELNLEYIVKIAPENFHNANEAVSREESAGIDEVEPTHYLFAFTDAELLDLIAKRDEWSAFDFELAQKILKDRGVALTEDAIAEMDEERLKGLRQTEPSQTGLIIAGYICAILGGLLGFFIGWHLAHHKKTLPNGETVFAYSEADRNHGKSIFKLAFMGLAFALFLRMPRG